jgi:integrase/recombinase XerD
VIKKFYDYLIEKGIRDTHPCRRLVIKGKDSSDVIHHELFTPVELEQLLHREEKYPSLRIRNQVIISLLIYQGLTISEIEKLKLYHIDLDTGMINVPRSKTISKRTLPMQSSQQLLFYRYLHEVWPKQEIESQDAFILNKLGDPLQKQPVKSLIKSMKYLFPNKNLNPTNIRKSVIANWLNVQKIPLDQVQLMSGQKWATSTEKYKYNDEDEEREMINRFFPNFKLP